MEALVHLLLDGAQWREARRAGLWRGGADDGRDGYLHLSTAAQLRGSAARHRAGVPDLLVLSVESRALGAALRWEPASGGRRAGLFPHLYGPLPLSAARGLHRAPLGADGRHRFPPWVPLSAPDPAGPPSPPRPR